MLSFFASIWEWITTVMAALMPFKRGRGVSPMVRWSIWIVLDLLLLALLYFLNDFANIDHLVQNLPRVLGPIAGRLRPLWLPILGQLVVFLGIVFYWFYILWFASGDDSQFPDIDEAWAESLHALAQAGVQLPQLPLFLVLGRPGTTEDNLFEAAGMKQLMKPVPAKADTPLRIYAGRLPNIDHDAVFITCRGASLLGKLAAILAMEDRGEGSAVHEAESPEGADKTLKPGKKEQNILEMLRASIGQEASLVKKRALRRAALGRALGADMMADPVEPVYCKARLAHLCRLIVRDRQPYCGVNGILLLVPLAGTDTIAEAQLTAQAAHDDLAIARYEMKLDCPVVTMLVDLEALPGFPEFMQSQPAKELASRRGSGFPMSSRLSRDDVVREIRKSLVWICTTYLQDSVYPKLQVETAATKDPNALFPGNANMVLLLDEMNGRADALSMIVQQAIAPQADPLFRYAGCYIAATGPKGTQGFVTGVLQKLVREQSCVSWTESAFIDDAQSHRWANIYFACACVLFVMWVAMLGWIIWKNFLS